MWQKIVFAIVYMSKSPYFFFVKKKKKKKIEGGELCDFPT